MPGSMKLFKKIRPKDINLELGVAQVPEVINYYMFNEPALNGFSKELTEERINKSNSYWVSGVIEVDVFPLSDILSTHLGEREIDFLSVDVEGLDLEVLKSNNWSKYRPKYVLAEILNSSLHELENDSITQFMKECGYVLYAKQVNTVFFKDARMAL
jgi:FkbM family methyltransferase